MANKIKRRISMLFIPYEAFFLVENILECVTSMNWKNLNSVMYTMTWHKDIRARLKEVREKAIEG